jgi:hypothetical protein
MSVPVPSQTDTYNTALDIYDHTQPLTVDAENRLYVNAVLSSGSVDIGKVDQGNPGTTPWPVVNEPSTDANITVVTVGTSSTQLLAPNLARKGIIIQCVGSPLFVILGSTAATTTIYSYYVLKLNALEIDNFFGTISAVVASGTATVQVTEKI